MTRRAHLPDRLVLALANVLGRVVGRPSEALLSALAARDRVSPRAEGLHPLATASHLIQQGQAAFSSGAYGEALHHFGAAIQCAPDAPWAWHGRGDTLQLSGQYAPALAAYDRAVQLNVSCGLHHAGRANALAALGQQAEADAAWDHALHLDPSLTWMREGSKNH